MKKDQQVQTAAYTDEEEKPFNVISGMLLFSLILFLYALFNVYFFKANPFLGSSPSSPFVINSENAKTENHRKVNEQHQSNSQTKAENPSTQHGLNEGFEGFEKGELRSKDWQASQLNHALAKFTIVEGENGKALQIDIEKSGNKNQWDIQLANEHVSVDEHQLLHFRAKIKGTRGAKAFFTAETQDYATLNGRQITFTGDWQNVAFELRPATEKIRVPLHFSFEQNTGARILVDDIQLLAAN